MKKLIATLMVLGALMSGNNIYAHGSSSNTSEKPGKTTMVTFENTNMGARLFIKDKKGQTLYSERIISDGSYTKGFDLSALPENDYYFEIDKEEVVTIFPFHVGQEIVTLHPELKENIVKPELIQDGNKIVLSREIKGTQYVSVDIYYEGRELVYSEMLDYNDLLNRRYDFSTSTSGDYLFSIKYEDDRTLNEYVNILTMY